MRQSPSNPVIRRMIVKLAGLHAEDLAAILAELEGSERQTVEQLLEEFTAPFENARGETSASVDPTRFSPWLAARLVSQAGGDMTSAAGKALCECAERVTRRDFPSKRSRTFPWLRLFRSSAAERGAT